jgi:hypothetical protein
VALTSLYSESTLADASTIWSPRSSFLICPIDARIAVVVRRCRFWTRPYSVYQDKDYDQQNRHDAYQDLNHGWLPSRVNQPRLLTHILIVVLTVLICDGHAISPARKPKKIPKGKVALQMGRITRILSL